MHVFSTFSTIKVKLVNEMVQSAYSCVILHAKNKKKNNIYFDFNLISNFW